jgi:hypothetical protein
VDEKATEAAATTAVVMKELRFRATNDGDVWLGLGVLEREGILTPDDPPGR